MTFLYAIRYFFVVPVVPPLFSAAFAVAIAAAALRLISDASAAIDALTPVLLLQLFVASSGFRFAARRGIRPAPDVGHAALANCARPLSRVHPPRNRQLVVCRRPGTGSKSRQ